MVRSRLFLELTVILPVFLFTASYQARVLPSAGFIPVLETLFCAELGEPDGFGFKRYPNSS